MATQEQNRKPGRYDPAAIESRWRRYWSDHDTFRTPNPGDPGFDATRPKCYILDFFPYPSGAGLHVGHPVGYCATDIVARYQRMRGFNVLHPMGFDAFGLPAEQYAIEHNVPPAATTRKNIDRYREQLQTLGFSYDWSRELATCDPAYYRWTQWMFAHMFESWYDAECRWVGPDGCESVGRARPISELVGELEAGRFGVGAGFDLVRSPAIRCRREWRDLPADERRRVIDGQRLAFIDEVPVNWCPALGTVLANEEVDSDGRSERGGHPVYRRPLRQWMLRITRFAERLLSDLDELDWPEPIKLMQRNWVGKSTGADVAFPLASRWRVEDGQLVHRDGAGRSVGAVGFEELTDVIRIYTTRPDTLFGATYMVLAPEHPLVEQITTAEHRDEVRQYVEMARRKSDLARTAESKEKTGVFTGACAINPVNGWKIPIWIADYVLMTYGTGAIMAVPGSDTRDFEFACAFDLPIVAVVQPTPAWIQAQAAALAGSIDAKAISGFDEIARAHPDLADAVAEHRKRSEGLGEKTLSILRERVGAERLIQHYVHHPRSWAAAFIEEGVAVNSPSDAAGDRVLADVCSLNGLGTTDAKSKIIAWLESKELGRATINYKLRDWLFSRQRYWGEPFPVLHGEDGETVVVPDEQLPVTLPEMHDFKPAAAGDDPLSMPEPPLGRAREWANVVVDGKRYRRDLNTMPQWAGSCWYYLRFIDPHNGRHFCDPAAERYWMPVDLYMGGAEHAVLHLLYARFWHKVLYDLGFVSTREPFRKLFNQGMIQGFAFRDARGRIVAGEDVEEQAPEQYVLKASREPVTRVVAKMSKSLKNVVNPDEVIAEWGTDTFRLYEMYMGPLDAGKPWNTRDVPGLHKLCQRIWRLVVDEETGALSAALSGGDPAAEELRTLHKTIKRVTEDLEQLKLNTAIAAIFDFVNFMTPRDRRARAVIEPFILVLAPFSPHLAEELWSRLGHPSSLAYEPWPTFDESLTRDEAVEIGVQVNGKLRARIMVAAEADEESIRTAALGEEKIAAALQGKSVRKVVVVKGRLVSIVAN